MAAAKERGRYNSTCRVIPGPMLRDPYCRARTRLLLQRQLLRRPLNISNVSSGDEPLGRGSPEVNCASGERHG